MNKLPLSFYRGNDVVLIAREVLGKIIVTKIGGVSTSGRIIEKEAYNGVADTNPIVLWEEARGTLRRTLL